MAVVANRRSVMTLFSGDADPASHRVRMVLAEKGITMEQVSVDLADKPEDLLDLNPYGTVPTMVDRDLVLYNAQVISEYLDERFPHPPLMPVDPVSRAQVRLLLFRVEQDLYHPLGEVLHGGERAATRGRKAIAEQLMVLSRIFEHKPFFMSDELTLVDCAMAPLLWRLGVLKIPLPGDLKPLTAYAERLFHRRAFRDSLTEAEREMSG